MTYGALTAALVADTDHVVCFGRSGGERRWQELLAAASAVHAAVAQTDGRRWALNLDDVFAFAAALLGLWAARKIPVIAPRTMLEGEAGAVSIDGVIEYGRSAARARSRLDWQRLRASADRIAEIAPSEQLVLYTSGSTGTPKEVIRSVHNVEAELAVLEALWGAGLGKARVYSTVSHRHVYGLLFRVLWPLVTGRPFATYDLEYPEQLIDGRGAGETLVSSPALLKRVGHLPVAAGSWRAVFSSGGLLPATAAADATRVLGACPVEVLGSTETSGVAWRRQQRADGAVNFAAMPKVEVRHGAEDLLEVRSPVSGQTQWLSMGDRVRFVGASEFELLGRGDHLAKIEDKRVSLAEIERCLLETGWVQDAGAVALDGRTRQFVGVVLQLGSAGAAELKQRGRRAFNEALKTALRSRIEAVALPRKFRYVEEIPVNAQGKRSPASLKELFKTR